MYLLKWHDEKSEITYVLDPDHPHHAENMDKLGRLSLAVLEAHLAEALDSVREAKARKKGLI